jgi:hypothetical protein
MRCEHCGGCGKAPSQLRRCSCGFRNPSEFSFCGDCGKRLKQAPRCKCRSQIGFRTVGFLGYIIGYMRVA